MMLTTNQYEFVLNVPEDWSEFDRKREQFLEILSGRFDKKLVEKILTIINCNWSDFESETAIVIEVEGTKCLTWITDDFTPIECAEKVFPFDETQIYPQQRAEIQICFKRYY